MGLFGREEVLAKLADSSAPLTLLIGDSGTGKSSALAEAQERSSAAVAPQPVQVNRAPGSLQVALLESMGEAVALLAADKGTVDRIGHLVVDATRRVADSHLRDLRAAVGRHLLGVVRNRVSPEMADLLDDFTRAISASKSDALMARITAASDNEVVGEIASFASEVEALADGRVVYLALDDLDRLDDDDLRRLLDLSNRLPPAVRIRGSFTTWHASSRARSESLEADGAAPIVIGGLPEPEVQEWLDATGLDRALSTAVMAATNGYPVHVQDAVALLQEDPRAATLERMSPDDVTRARVRQAWRELEPHAQIAAAKLAVYVDPLPTERICDLLAIDAIAWGTLEFNLADAGLLVGDGRRWFHELRRRAVWDVVLTDSMRAAALQAASDELHTQLALPRPSPQVFVDLALVAAENIALQDAEPGVRAAVQATRNEVAVAGAVLELVEYERGARAIEASSVLAHARDVFRLAGDPIEALEALTERGLIHVASNDQASVIVPTWGSEDAVRVLLGRAAREFGRFPIIQLATAVFDVVIRPRLGEFDTAKYGIGAPSVADAANEVAAFHRSPRDGVVRLGRQGPGLLIRAHHGVVPIYASVAFGSEDLRDVAVREIAGVRLDVFDETFLAQDVVSFPGRVVPSLRFAQALVWLDGRDRFNLHMLRALDADRTIDVREEVEVRQRLRDVVRTLSTEAERFAYELERPTGFAFSGQDRGSTIIRLIGCDVLVELGRDLVERPWGPYSRLRLTEAIGLGPKEHLGVIQVRFGGTTKDPVTDEIVELQKLAALLNKHQLREVIEFEEAGIAERLRAAFDAREKDGRAILAALPDVGLSEPRPTTTYVVLELDEPAPGWVPGAHAGLRSAVFESDEGAERVQFAMTAAAGEDSGGRPSTEALMRDLHGVHLHDAIRHSHGEAPGGLATMLGFERGEVRFEYSS